jgi:hypothetical protein
VKILKVKHEITHDFILDLYLKAKEEKCQEKKEKLFAQIEFLKAHIGEYLVKPS